MGIVASFPTYRSINIANDTKHFIFNLFETKNDKIVLRAYEGPNPDLILQIIN
jgi:hypothetical protein